MATLVGKMQKRDWLGGLIWPACLGWVYGEERDPLQKSVWEKDVACEPLVWAGFWSSEPNKHWSSEPNIPHF